MAKSRENTLRLANILDHLSVVEARTKNSGKRTHSIQDVRAKLGLTTAKA